jgi:hypothetical protein
MLALQVVTVLLIATTMSLALAHVLELPGKLRLDQQTYLAVQTIYYPGFTIGGGSARSLGEAPQKLRCMFGEISRSPKDHRFAK